MAILDIQAVVVVFKRLTWCSIGCTLGLGVSCAESGRNYLVDHMTYLASQRLAGRRPTTEGDLLARTYIAQQFAQYGLEPIGAEGYFQPFPFLVNIRVSRNKLAVVSAGRSEPFSYGREFVLDIRSGSGGVAGEVVFIGYGISQPEDGYDDFRRIDLRGRIVTCYLYPPMSIDKRIRKMALKLPFIAKVDMADSLGAIAFVFILPERDERLASIEDELGGKAFPPQYTTQRNIPVVRILHSAMGSILSAGGVSLKEVDSTLAGATESKAFHVPNVSLSLDVGIDYQYCSAYNIIGFLQGRDQSRTLILGAHYDHLGVLSDGVLRVGADDNASGVSVLLELARRCSREADYDCNLLFVAFGAEEWGFRGSRWFLDHMDARVGNVKAMVNFDTVGRIESDSLWIHHAQSAVEWKGIISKIRRGDLEVTYGPNWSATDSSPFCDAGIPALWFYCGHQGSEVPGHEIEHINFSGMSRLIELSHELIRRVASRSISLTYQGERGRTN